MAYCPPTNKFKRILVRVSKDGSYPLGPTTVIGVLHVKILAGNGCNGGKSGDGVNTASVHSMLSISILGIFSIAPIFSPLTVISIPISPKSKKLPVSGST